jgi:hypothetical protein
MASFLDAAASFPTAVFTALLAVVLFYWVLAVLGIVDFDNGVDVDAGGDPGASDLGTIAGYVVAFGLQGIPISIIVSLLILVSWTLSCLGGMWLLPLLPDSGAQYAGGAILGLASVSLAVPLASGLARPLRGLFVTHAAIHNSALVGQQCKVLTQTVDEKNGRAEVAQRGANLNIRVWSPTPNKLARGALARIFAYEEEASRYRIEADS